MRELKRPREFMPEARSVIMLTLHVWDPTFMMQINSPEWRGYKRPTSRSYVECSVCMYACPVGKKSA